MIVYDKWKNIGGFLWQWVILWSTVNHLFIRYPYN